ncbi:putative retroelement [Phytophthora palmivora]|uniref:Retroelement n=1 Tax=Phytophthora palmivora TaxID=4796 RepID=A0A2P4X5E7_9STRA|nr:putative retroelement [Phytophthora palmivora]
MLSDVLSRLPDYELAHVSRVTTDLYDLIRLVYQGDENYTPVVRLLSEGKDAKVDRLSSRQRAQLHCYELADGLLHYREDPGYPPRVVVPNDEDLKYDILLEAHDAPTSGHLGRDKTYQAVSQTFWWSRMYKWVAHYAKTCGSCQRVKPSGLASAPLQSLPVPADCWKSMSLDFVFSQPADDKGNAGILVFVCRLCNVVHLAPTIVSHRDPRFTGAFWDTLFQLLGTKLTMSTADHPQTDGLTERLPMVEFALNNAVYASTGFTPFYLNWLRHPQVPLTLWGGTDASIVNTMNLPLNLVSSIGSNKLKHRFIGPFAILARPGAASTIDLLKSVATHPTFYVGRLKRFHDPLDLPSQTEGGQGENSPPRNEAESSGQPELPVSKPVTDTRAGINESHTKGMMVQGGKSSRKNYTHKPIAPTEPLPNRSRNSAVNTPVELSGLTTKSVQILTKDL